MVADYSKKHAISFDEVTSYSILVRPIPLAWCLN